MCQSSVHKTVKEIHTPRLHESPTLIFSKPGCDTHAQQGGNNTHTGVIAKGH